MTQAELRMWASCPAYMAGDAAPNESHSRAGTARSRGVPADRRLYHMEKRQDAPSSPKHCATPRFHAAMRTSEDLFNRQCSRLSGRERTSWA
jgi:hypothetical protein